MRVMVFTPTWEIGPGELALQAECRAAIEAQDYPDFDWYVSIENPFPVGDYRNVLNHYQQARARCLADGYDALLTVEHDNVLPDASALARLMETPGDVVYAPYLLRHGARVLNTWQYINDRNLGMSLSHYRAELKQAREATIWRVSGAGFGCTLIRRHVLEAIEFTGATERDQNECPDLRFAEACLRKYFVSNGRFDVPVMHWDDGEWLHPFQSRRNRMGKYVARETANAIAAGRRVRLAAGEGIELSEEEARELNSLGLIRSVEARDAARDAAPVNKTAGTDKTDGTDESVKDALADAARDAAPVNKTAGTDKTDGTDESVKDALAAAAAAAVERAVEVIEETPRSAPPPSRRNREKTVKGK